MSSSGIRRWLGRRPPPPMSDGIEVLVRGGYHPDTIRVEVGAPVRLLFRREESAACSEQVVFPAFGKSATLPEGERVAIELTPAEAGTYEFTCAMGMLRGHLVVSTPAHPMPSPRGAARDRSVPTRAGRESHGDHARRP